MYDPRAYRMSLANGTPPPASASSGSSSSGGSSPAAARYGFIRSTNTWGPNSIPWDQLQQAGLTAAFASNDPNLDAAIAAAKARNQQYAIWIPAGGEGTPEQYAQNIANLYAKYGTAILPNIEAVGKGGEGSSGWQWNQQMMDALQQLGVPKGMELVGMGEKDFNYKPYVDAGVRVMPEAFWGNMDAKDINQERADLVASGVPENMIDELLAPSQTGSNQGSVYTLDDLTPQQLAALANGGGGTQAYQPTPDMPSDQPAAVTHPGAPTVAHDSSNRDAIAYANMRLKALARTGVKASDYGLEGLDPTAQWRALSAIVGARQAIANGHAGDYQAPDSTPDAVKAKVLGLLAAAQKATPRPQRAQAGEYTPPNKRFGPMQSAIHTAAGVRFLRNLHKHGGASHG